jgi:hypothetical protein
MLPSFMFLFFPIQRRANIMRIFSLFLARAEWSLWRQMAGRDNICRNTMLDNIFISQESELWTHCRARLRKKVGWKKKQKFIDCLYIDSFPSALALHSSHSFLFPYDDDVQPLSILLFTQRSKTQSWATDEYDNGCRKRVCLECRRNRKWRFSGVEKEMNRERKKKALADSYCGVFFFFN